MSYWGHTYLTLLYGSAVAAAVLYRDSYQTSPLRSRWLGSIATISYSMYLYHGIVIDRVFMFAGLAKRLANGFDLFLILIALAVTVLLAALSYHFIEKRAISWGHGLRYRT